MSFHQETEHWTIDHATPADKADIEAYILGMDGEVVRSRFRTGRDGQSVVSWRMKDFERIPPDEREHFELVMRAKNPDGTRPILGICHAYHSQGRTFEMSISVGKLADHHHGLGTALLAALIEYVKGVGGVEKLYASTEPDNERMIGLARKFGFAYEGGLEHRESNWVLDVAA